MSTKFEAAARALSVRLGNDPDSTQAGIRFAVIDDDRPNWMTCAPLVIAVLEAIREPDEAMVREGSWADSLGEDNLGREGAKECWSEMIDVLLAEARGK